MSRFIFVQPHLRFGGAERQTVIIANALVARGHEVDVVLFGAGGGLAADLDERIRLHLLGVEGHVRTPEVAVRLERVLGGLPPALVIVKLWSAVLTCALIDRWPRAARHTFVYCEDLDPTAHHEYVPLGRLKRRAVGSVFRSRPYVVANSASVAVRMQRVYRLGRRPAVTPVVLDPALTGAQQYERAVRVAGRAELVSVGSLVPLKGLDVTFAALQMLERPVRWTVVGDGPQAAELARFDDPTGRLVVRLTGGVRDPNRFVQDADLLVHSSRSEAWGAVLLEALAVGTPVVASDTIGPVEMRSHLGVRPDLLELYPVGSARDLARVVRTRLDGPRPSPEDCAAYVAPFSADVAVAQWERRAAAWTEASR